MPHTVLKRDTYDMSACREGGGGGGDRSGRHRVGAAAAGSAAEGKAVAAEALPAMIAVLQACVSGSTWPLADPVASGFYFTLLKTLRLLVPEASIWCQRKESEARLAKDTRMSALRRCSRSAICT